MNRLRPRRGDGWTEQLSPVRVTFLLVGLAVALSVAAFMPFLAAHAWRTNDLTVSVAVVLSTLTAFVNAVVFARTLREDVWGR